MAQGGSLRRRQFITLLGGAAWPLAALAQQSERVRRVGVLLPAAADDPEFQARVEAFLQALALFGWTIGHNIRIDTRWATNSAAEIRRHAAELVALRPEVVLAHANAAVVAVQQVSRTVPIVFPIAGDPVASGFVDSLAAPGGNVTGFMNFEFTLSGKWLDLLMQIAPGLTQVAVLRDATVGTGISQFAVIQAVASSLKVQVSPLNMHHAEGIERDIAAFARSPNGGLIITGSASAQTHRDLIIMLAARHNLPAIYFERGFVVGGGLMSYGTNMLDQYRRAAAYVDRILKGERPAGLPVQSPTKYELVVNLKTARALGLTVPPTLLARADEVIE
jgi:putative tryptophan/tyrosine transport system substrate-binding protein